MLTGLTQSIRKGGSVQRALMASAGTTLTLTGAAGLFGVISTRALGPYQRGLLATASVWSGLLVAVIGVGLPQAVTFHVSRRPEQAPQISGTALTIGIVIGIVGGIIGAAIAELTGGPAATPAAVLFIGAAPMMLAGFGISILLGIGSLRSWALLRPVGALSSVVFIVVAVPLGAHTALAIACVMVGSWLLHACLVTRALRSRGLIRAPQRECARELVSYGWQQALAGLAWLLNYKLDQLYLSIAVAPRALGLYAVAATIGEVVAPIAASGGAVMLSRVAARGHAEAESSLPWALGFAFFASGPVCLVCAIFAPQVLTLLFGAAFVTAAPTLRIYLPGAVALAVSTVLADTLRGLGRPLDAAKAEGAAAVCNMVLLVVLVPAAGINGAATASTIGYVLVLLALAFLLRRRLRTSGHGLGVPITRPATVTPEAADPDL